MSTTSAGGQVLKRDGKVPCGAARPRRSSEPAEPQGRGQGWQTSEGEGDTRSLRLDQGWLPYSSRGCGKGGLCWC